MKAESALFVALALAVSVWSTGCHTPAGNSHSSTARLKTAGSSSPGETMDDIVVTPWLKPEERTRLMPAGFRLIDQQGRSIDPAKTQGVPFVAAAFYTRCQNPYKCPLVARTMGTLHDAVKSQGKAGKVKLYLFTYDPEFDSPERLASYAKTQGLAVGDDFRLVQPDPGRKQEFFNALGSAVNFDRSTVNLHGIQLMLFDGAGRFVRTYHTVIWDNERVMMDLNQLIAE